MMKRSKQLHLLIVIAAVLITFAEIPLLFAQTKSEQDSVRCLEKIHSNCKGCIFAVSAKSKVKNSDGSNSGWRKNIGTAVPVDKNGYLITASSVVENATHLTVRSSENEIIDAEMIGSDVTGRIAVLKIDPKYIHNIPNEKNIYKIEEGNRIFSLGVMPGMSVEVSCGEILHIRHKDGAFEVTASQFPGTSGTPVFDTEENLIGIIAYKVDETHPHGRSVEDSYLALSFDYATVLARQVIEEHTPCRGWLGICIDLANSDDGGIVVKDITKGSPAEKAKILADDVIYEYNGIPVSSVCMFSEAFAHSRAGDMVTIKLMRGSKSHTINVTLESH